MRLTYFVWGICCCLSLLWPLTWSLPTFGFLEKPIQSQEEAQVAFDKLYKGATSGQHDKVIQLFDSLKSWALSPDQPVDLSSYCTSERLTQAIELFRLIKQDVDWEKNKHLSRLYDYLTSQISQNLHKFCLKPKWQEDLSKVIDRDISEQVVEKKGWLLESLVTLASYRDEPQWAPYSSKQLARVAEEPPPAGLLLYISRFDLPELQLDENMKNVSSIEWPAFKSVAVKTLGPLCRPTCLKLAAHSEPVEAYNQLIDLVDNNDNLASDYSLREWLAIKQVCCKLIKAQEFDPIIQRVYLELTGKPEEMTHEASQKELIFSEKVANNKH